MGRWLIVAGVVLVAAGLVWVGLERMGLGPGRMPGDLAWRGRHVQVFVPLGTCLALSVLLTLVMWVLGRLR